MSEREIRTDWRPTDAELIAYALRYLADDCEDHRPRTAGRMRDLADKMSQTPFDWHPPAAGQEPGEE